MSRSPGKGHFLGTSISPEPPLVDEVSEAFSQSVTELGLHLCSFIGVRRRHAAASTGQSQLILCQCCKYVRSLMLLAGADRGFEIRLQVCRIPLYTKMVLYLISAFDRN
jgi:hypothetical protein